MVGPNLPIGQEIQSDDPLLDENFPVGQISQPHNSVLETPRLGLDIYL